MKPLTGTKQSRNGSTIVGVLAALVFIGIVVAVMVKTTGSQAATSQGYGSDMVMSSTAQSGIIATEAYLRNMSDDALVSLNEAYSSGNPVILRENDKLSNDQIFTSKLLSLTPGSAPKTFVAKFEVSAKKKTGGKALKKVTAFYVLGNLETPAMTNPHVKNAFFSNGPIGHGNAGVTVEGGNTTFLGDAKFQNLPCTFEESAYFGDYADFNNNNDPVLFKDKAYFTKGSNFGIVTFEDLAYFGKPALFHKVATFENLAQFDSAAIFSENVTFNGNVRFFGDSTHFKSSSNATFESATQFEKKAIFDGKVIANNWLRIGGQTAFADTGIFKGETYFGGFLKLGNKGLAFHHRVGFNDKVDLNGKKIISYQRPKPSDPTTDEAFDVYMNGELVKQAGGSLNNGTVQGQKGLGLNHDFYYSDNFSKNDTTLCCKPYFDKLGKLNETVLSKLTSISNIAKIIPPDPTDRLDDELSIQPILDEESANPPKLKVYSMSDVVVPGTTNQFSLSQLQTTYNNSSSSATPKERYNGYLVVRINSQLSFPEPQANNTFTGKVIFLVVDGGTLSVNMNFYISGPESSTLIYLGAGGAKIDQFGSNGLFRGFLYIDQNNNPSGGANTIQFGQNGYIEGAVHNFSANKITWNGGSGTKSVKIKFDSELINDFAPLYPQPTSTPGGTPGNTAGPITITVGAPITVTPLGYFFQ